LLLIDLCAVGIYVEWPAVRCGFAIFSADYSSSRST
jgi:hypothetical protein